MLQSNDEVYCYGRIEIERRTNLHVPVQQAATKMPTRFSYVKHSILTGLFHIVPPLLSVGSFHEDFPC